MRKKFALALVLLLLGPLSARAAAVKVEYPASDRALANPFVGNAVWASDPSPPGQPFTLVYANLRWADIEPEVGVYAFEAFEEENHFDRWRAEGKRLILRFVMDVPGDTGHMDIPGWLNELTGADGTHYETAYGLGYCPNYANPALIDAHRRTVKVLGMRYGDDPFVAFVELGSLGHWGEWHVHPDAVAMPVEAVRDEYAQHYLDAFKAAKLLMRRPFGFAAANRLGLFNDMAGEPVSTEEWLGWIEEGGEYGDAGEAEMLVPMPDGWKHAPIGGELPFFATAEDLLGENFERTLKLFARSHASWIAPHSFADSVEPGGPYQAAYDELNRALGYRLRVSEAECSWENGRWAVSVTLENDGCAPLYFDWRPHLRLTDAAGNMQTIPLETDLRTVLPGEPAEAAAELPDLAPGEYLVEIGIIDPATGAPGIALAMDAPESGLWYALFSIRP